MVHYVCLWLSQQGELNGWDCYTHQLISYRTTIWALEYRKVFDFKKVMCIGMGVKCIEHLFLNQ